MSRGALKAFEAWAKIGGTDAELEILAPGRASMCPIARADTP